MQSTPNKHEYGFLQGGGEMGALTRAFDWPNSLLGSPQDWPLSLRTTLGVMLHSAFPMFLFWGKDLICFYNDAYRPSLGSNGKHPAVGRKGRDVWPEIWDFIGPLIDQVLTTGEPVWFEDQLLPIYRNNRLEDVYWTFSYSPAYDDDGQIGGVFVTCTETTQKVATRKRLEVSEQRFQNLVREASVGIIVLGGEAMRVDIVNDAYARLIGRTSEELLGKPLFGIIPEAEEVFRPIIDRVRTSGEPLYLNEQPYLVNVGGSEKAGYLNLVYQPYREQDGEITGVMVLCQDVTEQTEAEMARRESETRFQTMAEDSAILIAVGDETSKATYFSRAWCDLTGRPLQDLLDFGWADLVHPDDREPYVNIYLSAFEQKKPFTGEFRLLSQTGEYRWLLANGQPRFRPDGSFAGYISSCVDITERKLAEQALKLSEQRFQAAIAAVQGVLWTNNAVGEMEGEQPGWAALTGQTYDEYQGYGWAKVVHPDDAQPTVEAWNRAVQAHQPFVFEHRLRLNDGSWGIFSIRAIPLLDAHNVVKEWVGVHTDLTEQRRAEEALRTSEAKLRSVIQNAPVAIALLLGPDHVLENPNQTFIDILGRGPGINGKPLAQAMPELISENQPYLKILDEVYATGKPFYTVESPILIVQQGVLNHGYYNFSYTPLFGETGNVYAILSIALDVTEQVVDRQRIAESEERYRTLSGQLEQQVQERTYELEATNEELSATNEELAATNEELTESNQLLLRSNENLQRFAYVASHDLQEPLRKIQQFGDLLKTRYAAQLDHEGNDYLKRMQSAASRMSILIKDLLTFSRISTQRDTSAYVPLRQIVETVVSDLDVRIQETGAVVQIESLPIVEGDPSQLGQLFLNLLSNALKFRKPHTQPFIRISAHRVAFTQLPPAVKPSRLVKSYQCIDVQDNGIGFDEKYVDRIFQVFQRLHGKSEYAGTGIGLAICEKVVANHGGAITATSRPGQGATFRVYLPV